MSGRRCAADRGSDARSRLRWDLALPHPLRTRPVNPDLRPGITYRLQYRIPADKTVPNVYREFGEFQQMPQVFATGYMVALIEQACLLAVKPYLDWPREQTVGTHVDLSHVAATPPGQMVTVECEVTEVEGRRICFRISAHDEHDLISEGTHERTVIDAERFNQRLTKKKALAR